MSTLSDFLNEVDKVEFLSNCSLETNLACVKDFEQLPTSLLSQGLKGRCQVCYQRYLKEQNSWKIVALVNGVIGAKIDISTFAFTKEV